MTTDSYVLGHFKYNNYEIYVNLILVLRLNEVDQWLKCRSARFLLREKNWLFSYRVMLEWHGVKRRCVFRSSCLRGDNAWKENILCAGINIHPPFMNPPPPSKQKYSLFNGLFFSECCFHYGKLQVVVEYGWEVVSVMTCWTWLVTRGSEYGSYSWCFIISVFVFTYLFLMLFVLSLWDKDKTNN